jgi:hypothetical protein
MALLLLAGLVCGTGARAQDYLGFSHSNYAGIHGVYSNPASFADSRYSLDLNILGVNLDFQNDFLELRNKGFLGLGTLRESYDDWTDFRQRALIVNYDGTENGQTANLRLALDVLGPAAVFSLSPDDAIALGARYRTMVNFDNLGAEVARLALDEFVYPPLWEQDFESDGASLNAAAWTEYFAGYARTVYNQGEHFLKAGVNLKFIQGIAGLYMVADELNYNFTNDDTLTLYSSTLAYGHTENFEITDRETGYFTFDALGFGADLGVIYEWRPESAAYSGRFRESGYSETDRSLTRYKARVGFSVMDIGGIRFNRDPESYDRPEGSIDVDKWNLGVVSFNSIQDFDDTINNRFPTQVEGQDSRFGMNLPLALQLSLDYQIHKGLYVGAIGWLSPARESNLEKVQGVSRITLNPRYEARWFAVGVPLSYQNFSGTDAGLYLRLGPAIFGSANLLSQAFQDGIDGANIYLAFKVPILHGRGVRF